MWVLYSIKKHNNGFRDQLVSRLRSNQTYLIIRRGKVDPDFEANIVVKPFPENEVGNIRFKHDILLRQSKAGKVEAVVGDRSVNSEHYLHDEDIIRVSPREVRYRIRWESVIIYVDSIENEEQYKSLAEQGVKLGFHVVREYSKHVTHVYVSEKPTGNITAGLIRGLQDRKFIISKKWLYNVFLNTADKEADLKVLNDKIETIVWENFGPAKQPAILGPDERRRKLFEHDEFVVVDLLQAKRLKSLIEAGGGLLVYVNINAGEQVHLKDSTILIQPPESNDVDPEQWELLLDRYHTGGRSPREVLEHEVLYAIVYAATNYMCNPASSMSSVILSADADKKERTSCSMNATMPYDSDDAPADEDSPTYKADETTTPDQATMPYNAGEATMPYDTNQATVPYNASQSTAPYDADQSTMPYNADEEEDQKFERDNQCSFSASQMHHSFPDEEAASPPDRQETATPSTETASIYETARANDTATPHEASATVHASANNDTPLNEASPVGEMSPISALSPANENSTDAQVSSPLFSASPELGPSDYGISMDDNASLPDPMTDLNDFFSDFVGTMKPKPPPKKASTQDPPAPENIRQEPDTNESRAPVVAPKPPPSNPVAPLPRAETSRIPESPSPAPPSPVRTSTRERGEPSSSSATKRIMTSNDTPRPVKRKKVITREEEEAEEEAEDAKIEPTTPPAIPPPAPSTRQRNQSNSMDTHREEQVGTYNKVIYAPLVVHSRPPPTSNSTTQRNSRSSGGVNYKKFKKVKQFEYENEMDIVYLVSSSQRSREQAQQRRRATATSTASTQTQGSRIEDTDIFDPDLFIRSVRRN